MARDVVVLGQRISIVGLTTCWRSSDKNLHWVQSSELIELCVKLFDVLSDTILGVPWEFPLLSKLLSVFSFKIFLLFSS